jgi:predicted transcriptional regulator
MVEVRLQLKDGGAGYIEGLLKRMNKYRISQNAIARELGKDPSQVSRWFTTNPDRRVEPELKTVAMIEEAMLKLVARRTRNP